MRSTAWFGSGRDGAKEAATNVTPSQHGGKVDDPAMTL